MSETLRLVRRIAAPRAVVYRALIDRLDPEEALEILGPVLQVLMDAIHQHYGFVNQARGDGVMALFGAPIATEDHAVQACRAAIAMHYARRD